jgi:hypothetical protein
MKKVFEQREENTTYLLDTTISRLRGVEDIRGEQRPENPASRTLARASLFHEELVQFSTDSELLSRIFCKRLMKKYIGSPGNLQCFRAKSYRTC